MRHRINTLTWVAALMILALPMGVRAQVAPRDAGVEWPAGMRELKARQPDAWTFERAWKNRAAEARRQMRDPELALRAGAGGVIGDFEVPVFAVTFANSAAEPWPVSDLQDALFTWGANSLTDFYSEISGRRVEVAGTVRGWHLLPQNDTWYEGESAGTNPFNARVGELIRDTLDGWDGDVDFGLYDNDGPDGIPNSGDDDGYVDFVAFVHPESGAECGGGATSIWSHRWRYSAWGASGGVPFVTGDVSASGGQILIDDYTIQPALACDGLSRIEIGVFCHEFGHAFGLPDLYDTNGGGAGLGHWCLMASGNWNSPDSPAHMSAWAKAQLGWVDVIDVAWQGTTLSMDPVQESGTVYRLPTREDRWRRRDGCAVSGDWSLGVGLDPAASAFRGWEAATGYGNGWLETVVREFEYDGAGPVMLEFDYRVHTEAGFDFVFLFVEQDGDETTLAVYDGENTQSAAFVVDARSLNPGVFRIGFRLRTDSGWSNEDGKFASDCTAFAIDNVVVSGGGIDYSEDFETNRGGWFQPRTEKDNPLTECWLVENRQAVGFDASLHGEGLVVYHVDEDVMGSTLKNTGGSSGDSARGIVVEEADGEFNLLTVPGNRGDAGDVWTPSGAALVFDLNTTPGSTNNSGESTGTRIEVLSVVGGVVEARMWAGDPAPTLEIAPPDTLGDGSSRLVVRGAGLQPGLRVSLVRDLSPRIEPVRTEWIDYDLVLVDFDGEAVRPGHFDLLAENPDGQTAIRAGAIFRTGQIVDNPPASQTPRNFALRQNFPNPFNPTTTIRFDVPRDASVELGIFDLRGRRVASLHRGPIEAGYHDVRWEGRDDKGRSVASGLYFVRLTGPGFSDARKMMLAR
jgi:M6 family metalloprotease-like protein